MLDLKNSFHLFLSSNFIYFCLFSTFISHASCSSPTVIVGNTKIIGVLKEKSDLVYEAFLGIPYAQPPVGPLRFKEPVPYNITGDQISATDDSHLCIQYSNFGYKVLGSEDCLYLSIYRPQITASSPPLNVIVYIHGGAFMFGKSAQATKLLRRGSFVVASFGYRLGPLGFMSSGDEALPGNLGLKDQVVALKWIKDNIHYFNGNPESITLTGLSAGAVSVQMHLMSPLSNNLFNRAILCSGSSLNPWALAKQVPKKTRTIAGALNCTSHDSHAMVECLRTKKAEDIVAQVPKFMRFLYVPFTPFGPVIESPHSSSSIFLSQHPYDLLKEGNLRKVPIIIGMVTAEGLYPVGEFTNNKETLQELDSNWTDMGSYLLDCQYTLNNLQQAMKDTRDEYLQQKPVPDALPGLVEMVGDRLFGSGIAEGALMYAAVSDQPVYMYRFGYNGDVSLDKNNNKYGVSHGEDCLLYVFDSRRHELQSENDLNMSRMLLNMWESFASNKVPELDRQLLMPDTRVSLPMLKYLEIESPSRVYEASTNNMSNMLFWRPFMMEEKSVYMKLPSTGGCSLVGSSTLPIIINLFGALLFRNYYYA